MPEALRKKGPLYAVSAILAAALLAWIPMAGRFSLDDPTPVPVKAATLNEDPAAYLGRRVQVAGEVHRVYGPRAFALEQAADGGDTVLVVGRKPWTLLQRNPQAAELVRNDRVQVTGRVRKFRLRDFREEIGRHASDSLLSRWEGRPAVQAIDLELTPGVPDLFPSGAWKGRGGSDFAPDTAFGMP
jgi:hypothetical protein